MIVFFRLLNYSADKAEIVPGITICRVVLDMSGGIFGIHRAGTSAGSQAAAKDTLILRPGQIVSGVVLEANSENAVILINGINVVAELNTAVIPGERMTLQVVEQLADGKVLLQRAIVNPDQHPGAGNHGELEGILNSLGIKNNESNLSIVESLVRLNIPISQKTVEMLSAVAMKNNISPREVPALVWLWSRSLPITKDSIGAVMSLINSGFKNTGMTELRALMPQEGESPITKVVEQLLLSKETQEQWGQKLLDTPGNLGFGHEKNLLKLLEQMGRHNQKGFSTTPEFSALIKGEEVKTLKAALIEMLNRGDGPKSGDIGPMDNIANKMLKDITGYQLLNITGRQEGDGVSTFIPGWLAMQENEIQPFFLKVKQYFGSNRDVEPDCRCQVLFFISTQAMGEVMCRLALEKDRLTCGFTVNGEDELNLLDSMLPLLQDRLSSLPWEILIYPSKILGACEIQQIWYEETFITHQKTFKGLDARI